MSWTGAGSAVVRPVKTIAFVIVGHNFKTMVDLLPMTSPASYAEHNCRYTSATGCKTPSHAYKVGVWWLTQAKVFQLDHLLRSDETVTMWWCSTTWWTLTAGFWWPTVASRTISSWTTTSWTTSSWTSWSTTSWSTTSWSTASWRTASWSTASWRTASWSTAFWRTASWSTAS